MSRSCDVAATKEQSEMMRDGSNEIPNVAVPSRDNVHLMFDRISRRYDLLNHLLSFGLDFSWRKKAVSNLEKCQSQLVIDLACGTGDLTIAAAGVLSDTSRIIAIDKSTKMLALAARKIEEKRLGNLITLVRGDGMNLSLADNSADAVMIAFGIRNMPDTSVCLKEMTRLLRRGGQIIVLEFSLPSNRLMRTLHLFYLRHILPRVGRLISGDSQAYRYLDRTVETYLHGDNFCREMMQADLSQVSAEPLTFGVVTIYRGMKH